MPRLLHDIAESCYAGLLRNGGIDWEYAEKEQVVKQILDAVTEAWRIGVDRAGGDWQEMERQAQPVCIVIDSLGLTKGEPDAD